MSTRLWPEQFHKHVSVRRFDPLVVLFFRFHNFKSEFLVEIYGALVIYLNMSNKKITHCQKKKKNFNNKFTYRNMLWKLPSFSTKFKTCSSILAPIPLFLYGARHPRVIMYNLLEPSRTSIRQHTAPTTISL